MNKKFFLIILLFNLCIVAFSQRVEHVVIISIDGFRPVFYMDGSWPTANLQQLAQKGIRAEYVRSIFPSVTYPSHTTLITGCFPDKHGIYYNTTVPEDGKRGNWIYDFNEVKSETLWEAAKKAGLTTASVSWPISTHSKFIDYNIPEIWSFENPMDRRGATSKYATPPGLFEEAVEYATGKMEMNDYNLTSLSMDDNLGRIAGYIIKKYKPNLLTVHLPNTDGAQHRDGLDGDNVRRAIAGADHAVSTIYDALTKAGILDKTAIIITGDHGFEGIHTSMAPNVWLSNHGIVTQGKDWQAFFFSTGGSTFLQLKNKKDTLLVKKVVEILESLPESEKKMFRIVTRKEMDALGADPNSPMALTASRGFCFSNKMEPPVLQPANGGKHGHYPDFYNIQTGFIGYGKCFNNAIIPFIGLEDIAPLAAELLGVALRNADGTVVPGLFSKPEKSENQ